MKNDKKITVKRFLNKNLPNVINEVEGKSDKEVYYPLYIILTFKRKNTQIRSENSIYLKNLDQLTPEQYRMTEVEMSYLKMIVDYEAKLYGDHFTLNGLKDKYLFYTQDIRYLIYKPLRLDFNKILLNAKSKFSRLLINVVDDKVSFKTIVEAAANLIPDFKTHIDPEFEQKLFAYDTLANCYKRNTEETISNKKPTLIYWLSGTLHEDFSQKMKFYKIPIKSNTLIIETIDKMVRDQMSNI